MVGFDLIGYNCKGDFTALFLEEFFMRKNHVFYYFLPMDNLSPDFKPFPKVRGDQYLLINVTLLGDREFAEELISTVAKKEISSI